MEEARLVVVMGRVDGESYRYAITVKPHPDGLRSIIPSETELMVYGNRQDENGVKWHHFPLVNVVTYSVYRQSN